jgi:hypothetical protein
MTPHVRTTLATYAREDATRGARNALLDGDHVGAMVATAIGVRRCALLRLAELREAS